MEENEKILDDWLDRNESVYSLFDEHTTREEAKKALLSLMAVVPAQKVRVEPDLREIVLWLNSTYRIERDKPRGFRREGEKEIVEAEVRLFNGQPQLVFFYGKTRYTFNLMKRREPDKVFALTQVKGFRGTEDIPLPILRKFFSDNEIKLRAYWLKEKGI